MRRRVHNADLAKFGTPEQRNTPIEQFFQPVDNKGNATVAMVSRMQKHISASLKKLSGEISIGKQPETQHGRDPSKSNTKKASRINIPEKKASKPIARRSSKRRTSNEIPTKKRVRLASPDHSICSHNSAPPLCISREGTTKAKGSAVPKTILGN